MDLEKEMATHSSILAWKIPWTEKPGWLHTVHGVAELDMTEHKDMNEPSLQRCSQLLVWGRVYV